MAIIVANSGKSTLVTVMSSHINDAVSLLQESQPQRAAPGTPLSVSSGASLQPSHSSSRPGCSLTARILAGSKTHSTCTRPRRTRPSCRGSARNSRWDSGTTSGTCTPTVSTTPSSTSTRARSRGYVHGNFPSSYIPLARFSYTLSFTAPSRSGTPLRTPTRPAPAPTRTMTAV